MIPSYLRIWPAVQREDQVTGPIPKVAKSATSTALTLDRFKILKKKPPKCRMPSTVWVACILPYSPPPRLSWLVGVFKLSWWVWQRVKPGLDPILLWNILAHHSASDRWNMKSHFLLPGGWLSSPATSRSIRTLALGSRKSEHRRSVYRSKLHQRLILAGWKTS